MLFISFDAILVVIPYLFSFSVLNFDFTKLNLSIKYGLGWFIFYAIFILSLSAFIYSKLYSKLRSNRKGLINKFVFFAIVSFYLYLPFYAFDQYNDGIKQEQEEAIRLEKQKQEEVIANEMLVIIREVNSTHPFGIPSRAYCVRRSQSSPDSFSDAIPGDISCEEAKKVCLYLKYGSSLEDSNTTRNECDNKYWYDTDKEIQEIIEKGEDFVDRGKDWFLRW